jgi:hypothetical protein
MRRSTWNPTKRKGLRQVSTKRRAELARYASERAAFLAHPSNYWCPVTAAGLLRDGVKSRRTTDVHHMKGRWGRLLLEKAWWLAVSREGHEWIEANPRDARKLGWQFR